MTGRPEISAVVDALKADGIDVHMSVVAARNPGSPVADDILYATVTTSPMSQPHTWWRVFRAFRPLCMVVKVTFADEPEVHIPCEESARVIR